MPSDPSQLTKAAGEIQPCPNTPGNLSWKWLGVTLRTKNHSLGQLGPAELGPILAAALKFILGVNEFLRCSCHHRHKELNKNHIKYTLHFRNSWKPRLKVLFNPTGQRQNQDPFSTRRFPINLTWPDLLRDRFSYVLVYVPRLGFYFGA